MQPACGRNSGSAQQLTDAEREVEALAPVEPGVADRLVAVVEIGVGEVVAAAEALGDVLAGELDVHAAGPRSLSRMGGEEVGDLREDVVEPAGLAAGRAGERVAVHGVAGPDDRMAGIADSGEQRRQGGLSVPGTHTGDQRET